MGQSAVGVLALTRFRPHGSPAWQGMLESIDSSVSAIVVDLRGNSGGDDTVAYQVAQAISGQFIRRKGVTVVRSQHPAALTLMMNMLTLQMRNANRETGSVPLHLTDAHAHFSTLRDEVDAGRAPRSLEFSPGPTAPVDREFSPIEGPVLVLADARCGSSCENAVYLLRQLENTTVFGENTAGAIHFGQAGRLILPNSKAIVIIATQFNRFDTGSFWEKVGFDPDVAVPAGTDALPFAIAWAQDNILSSSSAGAKTPGRGTVKIQQLRRDMFPSCRISI